MELEGHDEVGMTVELEIGQAAMPGERRGPPLGRAEIRNADRSECVVGVGWGEADAGDDLDVPLRHPPEEVEFVRGLRGRKDDECPPPHAGSTLRKDEPPLLMPSHDVAQRLRVPVGAP
jgi:hypothetical protein